MAAGKANHIILWTKSSQVYSTASLETAIKTPVPKGCQPEDKRIFLMSYLPDEKELCVFPLSQEQIDAKVKEMETKEAEADAVKAAMKIEEIGLHE